MQNKVIIQSKCFYGKTSYAFDYTKNGSGNYAYVSGINNVGAKTGTSNWSSSAKNGMAGKSRDLWMSAYTSDYICSVWMGFGKEGIDKVKQRVNIKSYPRSCSNTFKSFTK